MRRQCINEHNREMSEGARRVLDFFSVKENIIDKDLEKLESKLNDKIINIEKDVKQVKADLEKDIREVKIDLKDDIKDKISGLRWFIGIIITVAAIVVPLIIKHL